MKKVIVLDIGRQLVKGLHEGQRFFSQAIVSEGPRDFNLNIALDRPEDYWIEYEGINYLVGDLAIRQSSIGQQERDRNKANKNNRILVANASSLFADQCDEFILIVNIPTRDWSSQKAAVSEAFRGRYIVKHKAGIKQGIMVDYKITDVKPLPEGPAAYIGYVYDDMLRVAKPQYLKGGALVLGIGDETTEVCVIENDDYRDEECTSLEIGLHEAHAAVQMWLNKEGLRLSLAEIVKHIMNNEPVYVGRKEIDIVAQAKKEYDRIAMKIYNDLQGMFKFTRFRNILLAGGGGAQVYPKLFEKFDGTSAVDCDEKNGQWLTVYGMERMCRMMGD